MQKTFFIADTHFGHEKIIQYENRPFRNVAEMDRAIIENWNSAVSKQDRVFLLGDVGFGTMEYITSCVKQLNGRKILVMGNHDLGRNITKWYEAGFDEVSKYPIILNDFFVLSHQPPTYFNAATPYFYIYGHVHGTPAYRTITQNTACVSIERWDYTPVELQRIIDLSKTA